MYGASLFENISFGVKNKSVDIERILNILKDLNLSDFAWEDEDGQIKTREISMDSTNISGGEKQRIAIARALYADSKVIVLDEPSSALDKISQNLLISAISKIKQNRIIIIITHSDRLTSVCDYVVELNKGRIINEFNNNS
jgi:HlyD family secretion protein